MSQYTIKNEAFIDLEQGVVGQMLPLWERYWMEKSRGIGQAADEKRWDDAKALVAEVSMAPVMAKREKLLQTLGMASMLQGASRLGRINSTSVYKNPPRDWLDAGVEQVRVLLADNATKALRMELNLILDRREYAESDSNEATVEDVFKAVSGKNKYVPVKVRQLQALSKTMRASGAKRGAGYIGLAANLHISRLNSAGFLLEAGSQGIKEYQVSEVLDSSTCQVCQRMHGMKFPVSNGVQHLTQVFSTTDPTALASISPWPRQNAASIGNLLRMDTAGLLDARLHLPPYHPNCRGIIVPVGTIETFDLQPELALGGYLGFTGNDVMAQRLFGDTSDIENTSAILFGAESGGDDE